MRIVRHRYATYTEARRMRLYDLLILNRQIDRWQLSAINLAEKNPMALALEALTRL